MCQYRAASIAQHYSVVCVPGQRSWDILYLLLRLAVNLKMLLKGKKKGFRGIYWKVLCTRAVYLKMWSVLGLLIGELVVTARL